MKTLVFTVTTDLSYDQRMMRICTSMAKAGYDVLLVGRERPSSIPLQEQPFRQKRLRCWFDKGKLFYAEYNIRLFFFLLFCKAHLFCAIDLDTIMPVYYISKWRRKPRVYDAHELFCEMEEIISRPTIYKAWKWIERHTVPHFKKGYAVSHTYVQEFKRMYGVEYEIIRNATVLRPFTIPDKPERYILYQGAVNEGRSFETLIPAMQWVKAPLVVCGQGNFFEQAQELARVHELGNKVDFKGYIQPKNLPAYTAQAYIGITLFQETGLSNRYSLANRFFDYMHHGVPQICVNYPEYAQINSEFEIAVLIDDLSPENIAAAINRLLDDEAYYQRLQNNCMKAREKYCWQEEEKKLVAYYNTMNL
jgi:glycosyltransferase involved in cell wall biosynthesis